MDVAKAVSARILTGDVPLKCDFKIKGILPNGIITGDKGELGIYISYKNCNPYGQTLHLVPRVLHVGIDCRKGISETAVYDLITDTFNAAGWDIRAIQTISSISIKRGEAGLLRACERFGIAPGFYDADELAAVHGNFTASEYVKSVTGVDNVCERAAVLSSGNGALIHRKTARDGVTIAVAEQSYEVIF
jgi:cobalt-precorrin 5A hydrolase